MRLADGDLGFGRDLQNDHTDSISVFDPEILLFVIALRNSMIMTRSMAMMTIDFMF